MKTKSSFFPAFLAFGFVAAHVIAAEAPATVAPEKPVAAAETPAAPAPEAGKDATKKKTIEKGMNAEEVLATAGKPTEIKPMESPDAATKVEQWIYRRKLKENSVPVATGQHMVQTFGGVGVGGGVNIVETPVIDYTQKIVVVYQVTALLMVNGKLEIAKQWAEQEDKQQ